MAPLAYVAATVTLLTALVLVHGEAAEFLSEHGGLAARRLLLRRLIGIGHVGLVVFARRRLWPSAALEGQVQAGA